MDSYFKIVKYNDNIYQFVDPMGVLSTLIIGDKKAMVIDTCYGIGNLKEEITKITDKELIVINSHGHMDHTGGNYQFDEVYIHEKDIELVKKHNSDLWRRNNIKAFEKLKIDYKLEKNDYLQKREGNLKILSYYQKFDLGDLDIEVLPLPGHTHGQIALYVPKMKLMVTSDGSCPFIWIFLEESTTVEEYIKALKKLLEYDFDYFLVGHGARMLDKKRLYDFLEIAETIDLASSVKVTFNNFENLNSYCFTHDKMYDQNGCGIVFDPNKLK